MLPDAWPWVTEGQRVRSAPEMGKKRLIRTCFAWLITESLNLMIHRKLNVLKKLQSRGSIKVGTFC